MKRLIIASLATVFTACASAPVFAGSAVTNSYTRESGTVQTRTSGQSHSVELRQQKSASAAYKNEFITPEGTNGYTEYRGLGSANIGMSGQPEVSCSGQMYARVDPAMMCAVSAEQTQTSSITQSSSNFDSLYNGHTSGNSHTVSADNF